MDRQASKSEACARRVAFVWVVRERCKHYLCHQIVILPSLLILAHIRWIASRLARILSASTSSLDLSVSIYVTSGADELPGQEYAGSSDSSRSSKSDLEKQPSNVINEKDSIEADIAALENLGVKISAGRPNIPDVLEVEVSKSDGPVSVDGEIRL